MISIYRPLAALSIEGKDYPLNGKGPRNGRRSRKDPKALL